jgi:hypothetical protein
MVCPLMGLPRIVRAGGFVVRKCVHVRSCAGMISFVEIARRLDGKLGERICVCGFPLDPDVISLCCC